MHVFLTADPLQQQSLFRRQISVSPDEIRMFQRSTRNLDPLQLRGDTSRSPHPAPTRHRLVDPPQTHSTLWSCPHVWTSKHGAAMLPQLQRRQFQPSSVLNKKKRNVVQDCHHLLIITETPVDDLQSVVLSQHHGGQPVRLPPLGVWSASRRRSPPTDTDSGP